MPFTLHEPFPSVSSTRPTFTGRGGAGNAHRTNPSTITSRRPTTSSLLQPPTTASPSSPSSSATATAAATTSPSSSSSSSSWNNKTFLSGRGGAGNAHPASERAMFSFDEELERMGRLGGGTEGSAPVYHIGRGGAGNLAERERERVASSRSSMASWESEASGRSAQRGSLEWVRAHLGRN